MAATLDESEEIAIDEDELEDDFEDEDEYEVEEEFAEEDLSAADSAEERALAAASSSADQAPGSLQQQQQRRGGNPLRILGHLRPGRLVKLVQSQGQRVQQLIWKLEDASVFTAKFAVKFAVKAARPLLMWYIVSRATSTCRRGRTLLLRTARQPPEQQLDYYYRNLLGADWEQQMEQDLLESLAEVQAGYITDDMVEEKRKLAAIMLRRMEVDEWDKQRMRHFFYGLYGLGPWYWDMEERLHNPFFVTARGWNSPPENWINQNQTFADEVPAGNVDCREHVLREVEAAAGRRLSPAARSALKQQEGLSPLDSVLAGPLVKALGDPVELRQKLEKVQLDA